MPETKPFSVVVEDVGGGVNEGAPSSLEDREWSALSNFHAFGTKLIRRGGLTAVSSAAYAKDLTSLFAYKQSVGSWLLLVGLKDGIGSMSGGIITQLSSPDVYPELDDPWIMRQYKDEVFACRQSTGTIKRVVPGFMHNAGIAAPLTAATISEGAAGAKEAGNRQLVYTHYVRATGAESNPSPVSNTLNLSASKKLLANGISISTNPQVDARRLYETSPNQEGEYYFVKQVDDNFTIDGIENNVAQDDLGVKASFENGMPPSGLIALEIANERLFATDGKLLYFSRPGLMQSFSEFDFIPVMEDDGHQIIDLGRCAGDRKDGRDVRSSRNWHHWLKHLFGSRCFRQARRPWAFDAIGRGCAPLVLGREHLPFGRRLPFGHLDPAREEDARPHSRGLQGPRGRRHHAEEVSLPTGSSARRGSVSESPDRLQLQDRRLGRGDAIAGAPILRTLLRSGCE